MQSKCPICFGRGNTPNTIGSWILGDVMRGKRTPCLSCHTDLPEEYEYALRLIDDKNFMCRESLYWEDAHKYNKEQAVLERLTKQND